MREYNIECGWVFPFVMGYCRCGTFGNDVGCGGVMDHASLVVTIIADDTGY